MMHHMAWRKCHVVQGSTYIRNTHGSLLAKAVDAEFFVTHFVYFPAMEVCSAARTIPCRALSARGRHPRSPPADLRAL